MLRTHGRDHQDRGNHGDARRDRVHAGIHAHDDRSPGVEGVAAGRAPLLVVLSGGAGIGPLREPAAFDQLDAALDKALQHSRNQLRNDVLNARRVLAVAPVGGAMLSLGAAIAVALSFDTWRTLARVGSPTLGRPLMTLETVIGETPAARATSLMVTMDSPHSCPRRPMRH